MVRLYVDIYTIHAQRFMKFRVTMEAILNPKISSYRDFQKFLVHDGKSLRDFFLQDFFFFVCYILVH